MGKKDEAPLTQGRDPDKLGREHKMWAYIFKWILPSVVVVVIVVQCFRP